MRIVPPLLLACLALAAPAHAAVSPAFVDEPLACFTSSGGDMRVTGYVRLEADGDYRFDPDYPEDRTAGSWDAASGAFTSGPLSGATIADAPAGTTMPDDQQPGRTWPLVIERNGAVTDHCRSTAVFPREAAAPIASYVERVSGLSLALPLSIARTSLTIGVRDQPYSTVYARVRAAGSNFYRVDIVEGGPCSGQDCSRLAIFSARRATLRHMAFRDGRMLRFNRTLARGVRGWEGNVGCAFGSSPVSWGPVYCGQTIIVWRHRGVNYAIEGHALADGDLMRMANEAIRSLPTRAS